MNTKSLLREKRRRRIRQRISGTQERPRLVIGRSLKHFSAQVIDDVSNKTVFALSTLDLEIKQKFPKNAGNVKAAVYFGEVFARRAKEKGISAVVFDRAGHLYHGRVKAFAESLRKGGLVF